MDGPTRLKGWRKGLGLSLAKAATKFGVTAPTVFDWESGEKAPSGEAMLRMDVETDGGVPIESWLDSAEDQERMREILDRRALARQGRGASDAASPDPHVDAGPVDPALHAVA